jgi:hemoglobin
MMSLVRRCPVASRFTLSIALSACAHQPPSQPLYQALGAQPGVTRLVAEVVQQLHRDPRLSALFDNTDDAAFQQRLNEMICQLADGGCDYLGLDMSEAHSGMDLSAAQFNYFVEDTRIGMTRATIPIGAQNRLLARLARLREQVLHQ